MDTIKMPCSDPYLHEYNKPPIKVVNGRGGFAVYVCCNCGFEFEDGDGGYYRETVTPLNFHEDFKENEE